MLERDRQPEWMDDPGIDRDDHLRALAGLARLNQYSGIGPAMYRHLRRLARNRPERSLRILDVASGAGDVPVYWARHAKKDGCRFDLTLTDIREVAVEEQQRRAKAAGVSVTSIVHDCLSSALPAGFDVVTSSLFFHHLENHQVFCLLQSMQAATDGAILLSDLCRSRTNLLLVNFAASVLTRSPVVHHDASASVRAAFTAEEFKRIAEDALARPVRVTASFPCRFIAVLEEVVVPEAVPAFA